MRKPNESIPPHVPSNPNYSSHPLTVLPYQDCRMISCGIPTSKRVYLTYCVGSRIRLHNSLPSLHLCRWWCHQARNKHVGCGNSPWPGNLLQKQINTTRIMFKNRLAKLAWEDCYPAEMRLQPLDSHDRKSVVKAGLSRHVQTCMPIFFFWEEVTWSSLTQ